MINIFFFKFAHPTPPQPTPQCQFWWDLFTLVPFSLSHCSHFFSVQRLQRIRVCWSTCGGIMEPVTVGLRWEVQLLNGVCRYSTKQGTCTLFSHGTFKCHIMFIMFSLYLLTKLRLMSLKPLRNLFDIRE